MATIEVAQRGQITIPKRMRDELHIEEGQKYRIRALEGGIIVLTPQQGRAGTALNQLRKALISESVTVEEMIAELRRRRETDAE